MTGLPTDAASSAAVTYNWSFHADNVGRWRWALHTNERLLLRDSPMAYRTRADAVEGAKEFGYREADMGPVSFPTMKRNVKYSSRGR
jgi:hypothetical protein